MIKFRLKFIIFLVLGAMILSCPFSPAYAQEEIIKKEGYVKMEDYEVGHINLNKTNLSWWKKYEIADPNNPNYTISAIKGLFSKNSSMEAEVKKEMANQVIKEANEDKDELIAKGAIVINSIYENGEGKKWIEVRNSDGEMVSATYKSDKTYKGCEVLPVKLYKQKIKL